MLNGETAARHGDHRAARAATRGAERTVDRPRHPPAIEARERDMDDRRGGPRRAGLDELAAVAREGATPGGNGAAAGEIDVHDGHDGPVRMVIVGGLEVDRLASTDGDARA